MGGFTNFEQTDVFVRIRGRSMGNYENGFSTRQIIASACVQLFYEKGFHETSYGDICTAAHVNRGTIYYHFPSKEDIRIDVQWSYAVAAKHTAERYCPETAYQYILAIEILYHQIHDDEKLRRFFLQSCLDHPVYTEKKDISQFYYILYDHMWNHFWDKKKISRLAFASVYGYLVCCMRMLCENPERYTAQELFLHCCRSSAAVWEIPEETIRQILSDIQGYFSAIPAEELRFSLRNVNGCS